MPSLHFPQLAKYTPVSSKSLSCFQSTSRLYVWVLIISRILKAQGKSGARESHWVWVVVACPDLAKPLWPLLPGACPDALAGQREAAARLLEVLEDLDQAHEEFQQREQGKMVWAPLGP